ncbi:MAG: universal stress protein [Acidimicrobiales bacterium]|nr:universal stress protein [Acidimicrobiales bacterium]
MTRIAVGVDESPGGHAALAWALAEARRWGATLEMVVAWSYLVQPVAEFQPDFDDAAARDLLDTMLAEHDTSGVEIEPVIINELPVQALLHVAEEADLLVVGARGLGGFAGLLLGSVSQQVSTHAPCPVVIVHRAPD